MFWKRKKSEPLGPPYCREPHCWLRTATRCDLCPGHLLEEWKREQNSRPIEMKNEIEREWLYGKKETSTILDYYVIYHYPDDPRPDGGRSYLVKVSANTPDEAMAKVAANHGGSKIQGIAKSCMDTAIRLVEETKPQPQYVASKFVKSLGA